MPDPTPNDAKDLKPALVRLLRAAFPHPSFPDGPFERCADKILAELDEDLWHRLALEHGLDTLEQLDLDTEDDEAAEKLLREIEDAEFFVFVRSVAVTTLYDDHEVWELLGYEGASFDKGGYLETFNDLDWLPDPRIEEYDGPDRLVEVAEHDLPAGHTTNA
ncbi:hypothetical protein GCM10023340_41980 [Nocardioides marinquilinus]|uniref:Gluconate 2-dehydrogenase subunit 3 family protein n=1 Tax=Nocardioides marinquilinus TaxID=1210400 RepID=A0ABP9Q245_9ACTN